WRRCRASGTGSPAVKNPGCAGASESRTEGLESWLDDAPERPIDAIQNDEGGRPDGAENGAGHQRAARTERDAHERVIHIERGGECTDEREQARGPALQFRTDIPD